MSPLATLKERQLTRDTDFSFALSPLGFLDRVEVGTFPHRHRKFGFMWGNLILSFPDDEMG